MHYYNQLQMLRLHQIWPGKNRFYCRCCITGPLSDCAGSACIYICTIIIVVPFLYFMLIINWNITPALPIIFLLSIAFTYLFMYLTACTDPGIIPRKPILLKLGDKERSKKYLHLDGEGMNLQFCSTCHIIRPKRTSHCSICQNCV